MSEHKLKREYCGKGEAGFIKPTCSCGWEGRPTYAYEDYQRTMVAEQERLHIRKTRQVTPEQQD